MRFVFAGLAFLVSLVCFGIGAWQIVEANSANHVTAAGSSDSGAPLIVVPSETLVDHAGAQEITLTGDGPIVAVVGRQSDVAGWVGETSHDRALIDAESGTLVFEAAGSEPAAPNPLGSDLWYQEYEGEGTLTIDASLPPGFALLVASTGEAAAPGELSITWPLDGRAPWSGPLFVAGIVFLLVALGLLLWALLSMRRGVRPRRAGGEPVALRPSTAPLAVGADTEAEADAEAEPDDSSFDAPVLDAEAEPHDAPVEVAAFGGVESLQLGDEPAAPSPFEAPDARGGDDDGRGTARGDDPSDDTIALPLAAEPQPAADPFADPWAPPAGAWAAPQEPVSVPAHDISAHDTPAVPADDVPAVPAPDASAPDAPAPTEPPLAARPVGAAKADAEVEGDAHGEGTAESERTADAERAADAGPTVAAPEPDRAAPPAFGIRTSEPAAAGPHGADDMSGGAPGDDAQPGEGDATDDGDDRNDDAPRDDDRPAGPPAPPAADADASKWKRPRGRDRSSAPKRTFRLAAILLVGSLGLTGCSSTMWPEVLGGAEQNPTPTPTSTVDEALLNEGAPLPAINAEQLTRILDDVRAVVAEADGSGDADALAARFTGAALAERAAAYQASAADGALPGPVPFPSGEVAYAVPQATDTWPRTVFAVVEMGDAAEAGTAPAAVMLQQESARDQYKVASFTQLAANVQLPEAAPMTIGAPGLDELGPNLVVAPDELAAAYGDLILNGDAAASADLFSTDGDTFLPQVGQEYRDQQLAAIDTSASRLEFSNSASDHAPLGIGTLDGGAIVAVSVIEVEKFSARTQLATLSVSGRAAALAGTSDSPYGFERTYTDQLLFYVPSAETGGQVQFLGYSQMMTSARQLDQSEVTYDA